MVVKFTLYSSDPRICVITTLRIYVACTLTQDASVVTIKHCSLVQFIPVSKRTPQ